MHRREFGSLILLGTISLGGCLQSDTQPDQVPIWVDNRTSRTLTGDLECSEEGTDETLLSTTFSLGPDTEESFYVGPVAQDGEYILSVALETTQQEAHLDGGRLREVNVTIRSANQVQIETAST